MSLGLIAPDRRQGCDPIDGIAMFRRRCVVYPLLNDKTVRDDIIACIAGVTGGAFAA